LLIVTVDASCNGSGKEIIRHADIIVCAAHICEIYAVNKIL
jgi:hypothetical protein